MKESGKEEPDPKYIMLTKRPAHADHDKEKDFSARNQLPRETAMDGVNMFENDFEQVVDTGENYLGTFSKHKKGGR